jgi:hypothetical protein
LLKSSRIADAEVSLHQQLLSLRGELKQDARVRDFLAQAVVLSFALLLRGQRLRPKPGLGLHYQSLGGKAFSAVSTLLVRARPTVMAEFRKLLKVGPDVYILDTLRSVNSLFQER